MGLFKPAVTWAQPSKRASAGQPAPGSGAQYTPPVGPPGMASGADAAGNLGTYATGPYDTSAVAPEVDPQGGVRGPVRPTKGKRSWFRPSSPSGEQRGWPDPLNAAQRRPVSGPGSQVPTVMQPQSIEVWTPYYSRGSAAFVQNFGQPSYNPIGAGVQALYRPQASYGPSGQYENGEIFWTSQVIPTSVNLQGLTDPAELAALLDPLTVYAVARVNG